MTKRVAVLRGGPSDEYDVSMVTGNAVLKALADSDYPHKDIVISHGGDWLDDGRRKLPADALLGVDVVFLALHGAYGEDGGVQRELTAMNIPYTGSDSLSSALAFNKLLTKERLRLHGVSLAKHRHIDQENIRSWDEELAYVYDDIGHDFFVKPVGNGSSIGVQRLRRGQDHAAALIELGRIHDRLFIEEAIDGVEASVGVLRDFRGEDLYAFPTIEVAPPQHAVFYDETVKYDGSTQKIVPGRFSPELRDELQRLAKLAHEQLGCDQYSRSDFMVRGNEVFFIEINTLPGFTDTSLYPTAADAVGLSFRDLVRHLVETARV